MKHTFFLAAAFFALLFANISYADGMPGRGGWGWHHNMMGGGIFMWIFGILIVGTVIYFLVNQSKQQQSEGRETPLDILQKRYARGDISREEYEEMKRNLEH